MTVLMSTTPADCAAVAEPELVEPAPPVLPVPPVPPVLPFPYQDGRFELPDEPVLGVKLAAEGELLAPPLSRATAVNPAAIMTPAVAAAIATRPRCRLRCDGCGIGGIAAACCGIHHACCGCPYRGCWYWGCWYWGCW